VVLTDLYCPTCDKTVEDVDRDTHPRVCACGSRLLPRCNGGTGSRYRQQDWPSDPRFYRGQCKASIARVGQYDADGSGRVIPSPLNGTGKHSKEAQAERRERVYFDDDARRGHAPIRIDLKNNRKAKASANG
jgi:hypothetical protein